MDYYSISQRGLGQNSKIPILKLGETGEVFYELALMMIDEIIANNNNNKNTVFICPVGPVGQYPIFVRLVNDRGISLKNCWFINMDEYLTDEAKWISKESPLSFRGFMDREVYGKIRPELLMPLEQRIFPDPDNLNNVSEIINKLGGVDICFGGIGINGHLAFNEPEPQLSLGEFAQLSTRILEISPETRTINCSQNGVLEDMPKLCITIGMKEILSARKIRLGVFRDWHRGVLRRAIYGNISTEFPVSLCQNHADALIIANANSAVCPL